MEIYASTHPDVESQPFFYVQDNSRSVLGSSSPALMLAFSMS